MDKQKEKLKEMLLVEREKINGWGLYCEVKE